MSKFDKKLIALKLRRTGRSLKSIAEELEVSKTSVSLWCRDIVLTSEQKKKLKDYVFLAGQKGRLLGATMNHQKKVDNINHFDELGKKNIGKLSKRDLMVIGAALYWAEGRKTEGSFTVINSDPDLIKLMYYWLVKIQKVKSEDLVFCLSINEMHRPRIGKVLKFWANLLQLSPSQFRKPYFIKTVQKKVYENYDSYYGIIHLKVKCGTNLRYHVLGLIKEIKSQINAGVAQW